MPAPALYSLASILPFEPLKTELKSNVIDVLFLTDRIAETDTDGLLDYEFGRSHSLAVGTATVAIGPDAPCESIGGGCAKRWSS